MGFKLKISPWIWISVVGLLVFVLLFNKYVSTTTVALVNFPVFTATSIARSTDDRFIRVRNVTELDARKLRRADFVLIFAMGIQMTQEERDALKNLAEGGLPVFSTSVTNPDNNIVSIDSTHIEKINQFLLNGNKTNYRSLLRYIRREIDQKKVFAPIPDELHLIPQDVFYHLDDTKSFETFEAFQNYYVSINRYREGAPRVAIVGSFGSPFAGNRQHLDSLITALERAGLNVYPILSARRRLEMLREVNPDAVINLPHGRLVMGGGDAAVEWLKAQNIPIFAPTTLLTTQEEWLADLQGMAGGFLSQSVVMPELDGAIYPFTLIAQYKDRDGFYLFKTIPDRLDRFVEIVNNFIALRTMQNSDKRVAVFFFKGPGHSSLVAAGMEVVPSLFQFLHRLKREGYYLGDLPTDFAAFERMVMDRAMIFGSYAQGAIGDFLQSGYPAFVDATDFNQWLQSALPGRLIEQLHSNYGPPPGNFMTKEKNGEAHLAISRVQFGNITLIPQPAASGGDQTHFQMVHGADIAPPYTYVGAYLWARYGFGADAIIHFGTHGSLEFTPQKQVSLSSYDWPDRLIGPVPHFYLYTISNVGEGIIAKRRSYATLISHITPPFKESGLRGQFRELNETIKIFHNREGEAKNAASLDVKRKVVALGFHRDLGLDSILSVPYTEEEIFRIENFADELANEKVTGQLYTLGVPYTAERIRTSVIAMTQDPLAFSLASLDRERGLISAEQLQNRAWFTSRYLEPSRIFIKNVLDGRTNPEEREIERLAGLEQGELQKILQRLEATAPQRPLRGGMPAPAQQPKDTLSAEKKRYFEAVQTIQRAVSNIVVNKNLLQSSPEAELNALVNALSGGYIPPSPGGDAVANPNTLPTGRNLFSINAEATPSESAWDKGVTLARKSIEKFQRRHGEYPRKVAYTFWSSEFIETEGATVAQALYMLGVMPVWDPFGRVGDLRLIPSEELGRPRIDVVVQTSGMFRDLAASRLALITRAVEMAANAGQESQPNFVRESTVEVERQLVEQGVPPANARQMSLFRVFGGINGNYGTGIAGKVESGDRWETESQIAETYLHNMGAIYGNEYNWGEFHQGLFEAVLHNTDLVIQPRQSNTWGPISLDHVFEFMGGINLAVRHVTGQDPDAYFSDVRNRHNPRIQEVKEAIGVEARTTILNRAYLREKMQGGASTAGNFAQIINNIYGWNVMRPSAIDDELWDQIHGIFVQDEFELDMEGFFERSNPAALQEITAIMLETVRKGYWNASQPQMETMAALHARLIEQHGPACTGFVCDNNKLRQFISQNLDSQQQASFERNINAARNVETTQAQGVVLRREELMRGAEAEQSRFFSRLAVVAVAIIMVLGFLFWIKRRKKLNL